MKNKSNQTNPSFSQTGQLKKKNYSKWPLTEENIKLTPKESIWTKSRQTHKNNSKRLDVNRTEPNQTEQSHTGVTTYSAKVLQE